MLSSLGERRFRRLAGNRRARRRKRLLACTFLASCISFARPHQSREGTRRPLALVKPPFRSGNRSRRRLVMQARRPRLGALRSPAGNRIDLGIDLRLHLVDLGRASGGLRRNGKQGCECRHKNELNQPAMILHRIAGAEERSGEKWHAKPGAAYADAT
jgi:hypothetical protein